MSSRPSRGAARLAAILDALPDALVLVNANGTVVNANTIALGTFEAPGTALVGRGLLDLLPEFDSRLIPGSMRRPDTTDQRGRTKPTRMVARRTDGSEFPVEVTSANLENGQQAYDGGYTGDELLMLVVRDLSGTVDTEAELARSQRQTEMILRAAAEGVVGTDTEGRIVLVNPAAAQILGYRASDLGGQELHQLVLHSRADGSPFPYDESPLADTLRSGRKHRVRGQVLWAKNGEQVSVDLTTSPVRDGDQLVGAVMTFTDRRPYETLLGEKQAAETAHAEELERITAEHADELKELRERHATELAEVVERHDEELAANDERYAALGEREKDRYEALAARHEQLLAVLGSSLRGPLDELRGELGKLAADDAGQLWPEANQVLHHLAAGYSRITTLVDNVLGYQRLDAGAEEISRTNVMLDAVVAAGVDGAVELIGPGRVQFAVHAPPIEAEVDPQRLATALAHLIADVAGVDATGNARMVTGGYMDNTVVVAAAQRGEGVRIEVRGPYAGGDPVHEPIVRGIVRAHGGVLQTHEVPGMSGSAFVLEVPIGGGAGVVPPPAAAEVAVLEQAAPEGVAQDSAAQGGGGRRRARRSSVDAFLESEDEAAEPAPPTGRRRRRAEAADGTTAAAAAAAAEPPGPEGAPEAATGVGAGSGRRRGRPTDGAVSEGSVMTAAEHAASSGPALGQTVPPQGVPVPPGGRVQPEPARQALPPALPAGPGENAAGTGVAQPTGRRRRALAAAQERATAQESGPRQVFALPPAAADRGTAPEPVAAPLPPAQPMPMAGPDVHDGYDGHDGYDEGRHDAALHDPAEDHTPPQPHPVSTPSGRRRAPQAQAPAAAATPASVPVPAQGQGQGQAQMPVPAQAQVPAQTPVPAQAQAQPQVQVQAATAGQGVPAQGLPAQALPTQHAVGQQHTMGQGMAGQGIPGQGVPAQTAPGQAVAAQANAVVAAPGQGVPEQSLAGPGPVGQGAPVPVPGQAVAAHVNAGITVPGQALPGHSLAGQGVPAQVDPGLATSGQGFPAQALPTHSTMGQGIPQGIPGQAGPAQSVPGPGVPQQGMPGPGGPGQGIPAQSGPGQALPPGQAVPGQAVPGQAIPGQAVPGQAVPGQAVPSQALPPQGTSGQGLQPQTAVSVPAPGAAAAPAVAPSPTQNPNGRPALGTAAPAQAPAAPQVAAPGQASPTGTPVGAPPASPATGQYPAGSLTPGGPTGPTTGAVPTNPSLAGTAAGNAQARTRPQTAGTQPRVAQPLPAEAPVDPNSTQGRAISVRTLGQGVPFVRQPQQNLPQGLPQHGLPQATPPPVSGTSSGRRRKLGTPPEPTERPETGARPHPNNTQARLTTTTDGAGRSYAIGAPDENADEGPEPLDGPGGAVEVADPPQPQPMDDELPPEPLDNPRRLLVWPAPDAATQQALSERGYRPVVVNSREEVDAQIAAFPAALFVDPLTGPITRTALQSLRQAAVAAEVPVLVTAGLGQATRDAAYGADPAVLLKALAPRDSEQHPPRVLLIEEHAEISLALTSTLERRGMQVARAANDADAVTLAAQMRPNLVVMDLMQVRRRRAGIIDWLRANGQLNRTPLVVYTAAVDRSELPRLAAGETVLFLAERSTSTEVQTRIVDLLARIGTN
ncbi:PAS domain-containing protein [Streptomyces cavernae]|uniref:PAS domain-containing protein n=1 Tax=Streptomyces cavernae TaxID=2259034 RepID=UPI000FEB73B4|nr:PAS domain-containing protein [Streptomyces cavernae]